MVLAPNILTISKFKGRATRKMGFLPLLNAYYVYDMPVKIKLNMLKLIYQKPIGSKNLWLFWLKCQETTWQQKEEKTPANSTR
jgi:hypothetical protein